MPEAGENTTPDPHVVFPLIGPFTSMAQNR
jgi:hypothetical protein